MKPSARGAAGQADVQEVAGGLRGRRRGADGRSQDTEAGQGAAVQCEAAVMAGEWDGGGGSLGLLSRTATTEPPHLAAGKTRTRKVRLEVKKRPLVSAPLLSCSCSACVGHQPCNATCFLRRAVIRSQHGL